jgi:DNA-binding FadR family transcriptional regulator
MPGILRAVVRERGWPTQKELSAELRVSQQAVSKALKNLEAEHGISRTEYDPTSLISVYNNVNDLDIAVTWGLSALDDPLSLRPAVAEYLNSLDVDWAFTGVLAADR